jgi:hypothetical protein
MKNRGGKTCEGCPFGIGIPFGCKMIGESAYDMKDLSESECKEDDLNLNFEKIFLIKEHNPCVYAGNIYQDYVSCSYEDQTEEAVDPISGSPYYPGLYPQSTPQGGLPRYGDSTTLDDNYVNIYTGLPDLS